ncbi:MAG TPA: hypothetical protein VKB09_08295 [Thermomicrobiales bacterium]|nr:hypothetical protein [Thermomicrobiales bacterium]
MDENDEQPPSQGTEELVRHLSGAHAYIQTLPAVERRIANLAASGMPVWQIAQQTRESEGAVWRTLDGIVAVVTGREVEPVETGGLGADTDPGVTGGYGDTGFGALDTEPLPDNTEPKE